MELRGIISRIFMEAIDVKPTTETATLVPLNWELAKKWGKSELKISLEKQKEWVDFSISKSLKVGDKIVGCYVLGTYGLETFFHTLDDSGWKYDLKRDVTKYYDMKGVEGIFYYILPEYRKLGYGTMLREYAESLGDYIWGGTFIPENLDFYLKRRDIVATFTAPGDSKINYINASKV